MKAQPPLRGNTPHALSNGVAARDHRRRFHFEKRFPGGRQFQLGLILLATGRQNLGETKTRMRGIDTRTGIRPERERVPQSRNRIGVTAPRAGDLRLRLPQQRFATRRLAQRGFSLELADRLDRLAHRAGPRRDPREMRQ